MNLHWHVGVGALHRDLIRDVHVSGIVFDRALDELEQVLLSLVKSEEHIGEVLPTLSPISLL